MNSAAKSVRELVDFYLDAGVDALVGEEPVDRFADEVVPPPQPAAARAASPALPRKVVESSVAATPAPPPAPIPASPETAIMAARDAAKSAQNLDELRALLEIFEGCMLRATATQLVFAAGNPASACHVRGRGARPG